ncbi:helix-turn-helix domain-containing protein [Streptomyces sp. NPDC091371]|uniref:TetR/AcrR family transcriptional regulator n=1 Tax=Streptomyces sp. NPDC091371 TaxID=3155303 RepID=UPI00341CBCA3
MTNFHPIPFDSLHNLDSAAPRSTPARTTGTSSRSDQSQAAELSTKPNGSSSAIGAHGPGRLTLAHVGAEAGVSPATLSQSFGSKRGLLLVFAADAAAHAAAPYRSARAEHDSPLAALHAVAESLAGHMATPEEMANHLSMLQLDLSDPEFRVRAATHTRAVEAALQELLTDAVARASSRPAPRCRASPAPSRSPLTAPCCGGPHRRRRSRRPAPRRP